jgi:hypothetical protein
MSPLSTFRLTVGPSLWSQYLAGLMNVSILNPKIRPFVQKTVSYPKQNNDRLPWKILRYHGRSLLSLWIPYIDCLDIYHSVNPLFTKIEWDITSHGIYELTLAHQPFYASLFHRIPTHPCS